MRTQSLVAVLLLAAPVASAAQHPRDPRVDSVFARFARQDSPGCAVGVYRDGRIIHAAGYGMADLERRVPITPASVFDIGSTSKQFAAAAIVLLAQQGKLSLSDDVRRFIPELPQYSRPITIRHLLNHTSGIRDYIGLLNLGGHRIDDVTTDADALAAIARQKALNFEPGAEFLYSNSGYFLLSIIVQRASGQSLRDFARTQIFEPLGMRKTHYLGSYDDVVPDRALAYAPRQGGGYRHDMSRWLQLGDGAVWTTVEELLLWDENFYEPRVGGRAMLDTMHVRGRLTNGDSIGYALGIQPGTYRGQRVVRHGGAWGGYRADLARFPDQHYSVAALCNVANANPSQLIDRVADIHLAGVLTAPGFTPHPSMAPTPGAPVAPARETIAVPEAELRAHAGLWRHPSLGDVRTVFEQGKLFLVGGGGRFELRPVGPREFEVMGAPARVFVTFAAPAARGAARTFRWDRQGRPADTVTEVLLVTPTAAEIRAYAGRYFSEELDVTFTVTATDSTLLVRRGSLDPATLRPRERDEFTSGGVSLRFTRDARGRITGATLEQGRVRCVTFRRLD